MKRLGLLLSAVLLCAVGCSTAGLVDFEKVVKKRASYDFNCPENYVQTIQLTLTQYGAKGCGKQSEYEVKCSLGPCVAHATN